MSRQATTYGAVSRFNHWLVGIAMIFMLAFGLLLEYGDMAREIKRFLMWWHKSIGVLVLVLGFWRLGWRWVEGAVASVARMAPWQVSVNKAVHRLLMAGIVLMPLSGILHSMYSGRDIDVFGLFTIRAVAEMEGVAAIARGTHTWVGYLMIALVLVHVLAALKHHYWDRDATLSRMWTGRAE